MHFSTLFTTFIVIATTTNALAFPAVQSENQEALVVADNYNDLDLVAAYNDVPAANDDDDMYADYATDSNTDFDNELIFGDDEIDAEDAELIREWRALGRIFHHVIRHVVRHVMKGVGRKVGRKVVGKIGRTVVRKVGRKVGSKIGRKIGTKVGRKVGQKFGRKIGKRVIKKTIRRIGSEEEKVRKRSRRGGRRSFGDDLDVVDAMDNVEMDDSEVGLDDVTLDAAIVDALAEVEAEAYTGEADANVDGDVDFDELD